LKTLLSISQFHNSRPVMSQTVSNSRGWCRITDHSIWHSWCYQTCSVEGFFLVLSIPLSVSLH